ncbi:MAG: hypothetical protein HOG80_04890 [Candidatus Marinimicrobia bacterium]|jgi:lipopolysaccharide cholinephosphotransferase|nr:hypothetical protein [Candidatus Neomarinimicrobiota bacterium]
MKKIVIFGASNAGSVLYDNLMSYDDVSVICFSDNNDSIIGKNLKGVEVVDPDDIKLIEFDFVYIGSQFGVEIKEQLVNVFGIHESKVVILPKYMLSPFGLPFKEPSVRLYAREVICKISNFLFLKNIKHILSYGSLLGIYRDDDVISWDTDVDFSIFGTGVRYANMMIELTNNLNECTQCGEWVLYEDVIRKTNQIQGFHLANDVFYVDFSVLYQLADGGLTDNVSTFSEDVIGETTYYEFNGKIICVPERIEEYLKHLYGENWMIQKKDCSIVDTNTSLNSKDNLAVRSRVTI